MFLTVGYNELYLINASLFLELVILNINLFFKIISNSVLIYSNITGSFLIKFVASLQCYILIIELILLLYKLQLLTIFKIDNIEQ